MRRKLRLFSIGCVVLILLGWATSYWRVVGARVDGPMSVGCILKSGVVRLILSTRDSAFRLKFTFVETVGGPADGDVPSFRLLGIAFTHFFQPFLLNVYIVEIPLWLLTTLVLLQYYLVWRWTRSVAPSLGFPLDTDNGQSRDASVPLQKGLSMRERRSADQ
jgi:hypothetical protein